MTDMDQLMDIIRTHWKFNAESYPEIAGMSEEQRQVFAIRHAIIHFAKTAGKAIAVVEGMDHGGSLDAEELKAQTGKMFINTLMMAQLLNLSGEDLAQFVRTKYLPKIEEGAGV
jgi:NTP pyrophosphatase (non-canonical NTP hydrolase)